MGAESRDHSRKDDPLQTFLFYKLQAQTGPLSDFTEQRGNILSTFPTAPKIGACKNNTLQRRKSNSGEELSCIAMTNPGDSIRERDRCDKFQLSRLEILLDPPPMILPRIVELDDG